MQDSNIMLLCYSCNETDQFKKYSDLNKKLYRADENEVFKLTGCLSTCDKYEYMIQPDTTLHRGYTHPNMASNELKLHLYFLSGRHEVKEQVIQYFSVCSIFLLNDIIYIISSI